MTRQEDRYILSIYSEDEDGIITDRVNLTDGKSYGIGPGAVFAPPPPQKVVEGADSAYRHGHDVVRVRYDNSTVDIRSLIIMGDRPEILAQRIRRITTLLEKTRYRQERGWGERVYVERDWRYSTYSAWDIDPAPEYFFEDVTVLRKEVLRGEFMPPRESVTEIIGKGLEGNCRLTLQCYPFWQGLIQNVVLEYTIDNHTCDVYPPAKRNYVNLDRNDLLGDAPCLMRVRLELVSAGNVRNLRMGVKRLCFPNTAPCCSDLTYQTEDYHALGADTALQSAPAEMSCDTGVRVTPSNANNVERVEWRVEGDTMSQGTYRVFLLIKNRDNARTVLAQFRLRSYPAENAEVFVGDQIEVTTYTAAKFAMLDLGLVTIPPENMGTWYPYPDEYGFEVWTESDAAAGTIDIDYLLLLPVEGGLKLEQFGIGLTGFFTFFVTDAVWEMNGFLNPPVANLYYPPGEYWAGPLLDDLGDAAALQPGFDHCLVFNADNWSAPGDNKAYSDLNLQFKVTVDVLPQYMYIR